MEIPDLKIECLRCTASELLSPGAVQRDASGTWQPINTRRPEGWLQGPAPLGDPTKGVCPKCAGDWLALQGAFLESTPSDPTVDVRTPDITFKPKAISTVPLKVGQIPSAHIPLRDEEPARVSSIPTTAPTPPTPQVTLPADAPPAAVHQLWHNRNVKVEPIRAAQLAVPAQRITSFAHAAPNVRTAPITHNGGAVASAGVRSTSVAPVTSQRIMQTPQVGTPMPLSVTEQTSYNVTKVERGVTLPVGRASAPMPIVASGHLPNTGGMVTTSAPVPIRGLSVQHEDGSSQQGVVTISAPVPIAPKE